MSERGWEGGEGEVAEGGDREMEKGRIGMNVVSVYSGTSEIRTPRDLAKVSLFRRCP